MQKPTVKHWIMLASLVVVWGGAFGLIAVALRAFQPVTIVWVRLLLGALTMLIILRLMGKALPREFVWWRRMVVLSFAGNILPFCLIAWAEQTVPSSQAGILMALMPVTVMVLGHYFLPDEKISIQRLFGAAIGFLGVFVLIGANLSVGGDKLSGQLATIAATFAYAGNAIYTKRLPNFEPAGVTAGSLIIGVVALAIPVMWLQPAIPLNSLESALQPLLAVSVLGVVGTGIATWFYFEVVRQVGPGFLSTINYLIPGFAFVVGIGFLGETGGLPQLLSLVLIIAGVWLIQPKHKIIQAD